MSSGGGWMFGLAAGALGLLVTAGAAAQGVPAAPDAPDSKAPAASRTGEQIMNGSCTGACHDVAPIQTAAKDEAAWNQTLDNMLMRGASLQDADRPVLVQYLVRFHGPMPDGTGKSIVLNTCTICHDLTRVKRSRHTAEEWEAILISMLNEGAPLSDEDFPTVLLYLARNFGLDD